MLVLDIRFDISLRLDPGFAWPERKWMMCRAEYEKN
jgi:hypothetical protein